jgi:hypothetical protein
MVVQLLKKLTAFDGYQKFITIYTKVPYVSTVISLIFYSTAKNTLQQKVKELW